MMRGSVSDLSGQELHGEMGQRVWRCGVADCESAALRNRANRHRDLRERNVAVEQRRRIGKDTLTTTGRVDYRSGFLGPPDAHARLTAKPHPHAAATKP